MTALLEIPKPQRRRLLEVGTDREVELVYVLPEGAYGQGTEEPSLAELLQRVWQRRFRIGLVVLVAASLAAGMALLQADRFAYSAAIEIGQDPVLEHADLQDRWQRFWELPADLAEKIDIALAPALANELSGNATVDRDLVLDWELAVDNPIGTALIVLRSEGPAEDADFHLGNLRRLVDTVVERHAKQMALARNALTMQLSGIERGLKNLADELAMLAQRRAGLETERGLRQARETQLSANIEQARADRRQALVELQGQAQTLTLMMIDRGTQTDDQELNGVRQRLSIGIVNDLTGLDQHVLQVQRQIEAEQQRREDLRLRLESLRETRAVTPPQRSLEEIGPKRALLVIGAGLAVLMLACFVAVLLPPRAAAPEPPAAPLRPTLTGPPPA